MVSINDIAKEAGVTKSTVSKIINNRPGITPSTRKRVMKVIEKYDYRPNFFACHTSKKLNSNLIGLICEKFLGMDLIPYFSTFITNLTVEAKKYNKNIVIYLTDNDEDTINVLKNSTSPIDGAIFLNPTVNNDVINQLQRGEIPVVCVGKPDYTLNKNLSYCDVNVEETSFELTNQLFKKGFKNPVFLTYDASLTVFDDRISGYKNACKKHKANPVIQTIQVHDKLLNSIINDLLDRGHDSIILPTTLIANEVVNTIKNRKYKVGKDIYVCALGYGFDDKNTIKNITYAEEDWGSLGIASFDLLNQMLNNEKQNDCIIVKNKIHYCK